MSAGVILALAVAIAVAIAIAVRSGRRGVARHRDAIREVLAHNGAGRCLAAIPLLRTLAAGGDQQAIAAAWEALELPLVQALPDCPPDAKPELVVVLDACAQACSNRELTKRIMTLRRSIYP
jgi:hypothetical protein